MVILTEAAANPEAYDFTVLMGLADFIPVVLFAVSMVLLQRDLYNKMPKYAFACFAAGTINVLMAGFMKALWKTLYAAGVCDFQVLNKMFLPVNSLGFLLAGLGIILMFPKRGKMETLSVVGPLTKYEGTMVFISMMVLGLGAICACLSILAAKMKKKGLIVVFVLCFIAYMGMGYLGSRGDNSAAANWIEQGVNTLGMILLLWGTLGLHKAGLREFELN
ncbi:MAG: hypothetical protein IKH34_09355 [Oscillospiraceae bacterium]|nr:hypothetical protein [Oscillospiraceae bacterium]